MLTLPPPTEIRRRLPRLSVGLTACGVGLALMVRSDLGLGPWEVLHQGISQRVGLPIGFVGIVVGFLVLLGWIPMRQRMGIGTLSNVIWMGIVIDGVLAALPEVDAIALRIALLVAGIALFGAGSGLYIGAGLGPGPRDGLMTGIASRGYSLRLVRTAIEVSVLVAGWLLGGTVGIGTVLFAFTIGPLVQLFLPRFTVPLPHATLTAPAE